MTQSSSGWRSKFYFTRICIVLYRMSQICRLNPLTDSRLFCFLFASQKTTDTRYCRDQDQKQSLMARWRYPTLTVHKIDVSHNNPTIIPRRAQAAVSMRIVPDQDIGDICTRFSEYVQEVFGRLKTDNRIEVRAIFFFFNFPCKGREGNYVGEGDALIRATWYPAHRGSCWMGKGIDLQQSNLTWFE